MVKGEEEDLIWKSTKCPILISTKAAKIITRLTSLYMLSFGYYESKEDI